MDTNDELIGIHPPDFPGPWLKTDDVAYLLGVKKGTVNQWQYRGKLVPAGYITEISPLTGKVSRKRVYTRGQVEEMRERRALPRVRRKKTGQDQPG